MPAGPPLSDDGVVAMLLIGLVIFALFCLGLDAVLSDDATFADPHEATDAMVDAFDGLRRACGLPPTAPVATAMAPAPALG